MLANLRVFGNMDMNEANRELCSGKIQFMFKKCSLKYL